MSSSALATILSVVALGGFGIVYLKLDRLEDRIERQRSGSGRRAAADHPDAYADRGGWADEPARAPDEDARIEDDAGAKHAADEPAKEEAARKDDGPSRDELAARVKKLEAQVRKGKVKRKRVRSTTQLGKALGLTKAQEDQITTLIDDGKRRIEAVMKIPDGSGTSPWERRETLRQQFRDAMRTGDWGPVKQTFARQTRALRHRDIPGRNTTYGEEQMRIARETRDQVVRSLTERQRGRFEDISLDAMLTDGGYEPKQVAAEAKREAAAEDVGKR